MAAFAVPLTNIFALLGAGASAGAAAPNGFGLGSAQPSAAPSPFSSLVASPNGFGLTDAAPEAEKGNAPQSATAIIKSAKANMIKQREAQKDTSLASPELLLSDLLAVDLSKLQPGDTIALPNGWELKAGDDGMFTLANAAANIEVPPFSKAQLDALAQKAGLTVPAAPIDVKEQATTGQDDVQEAVRHKEKKATGGELQTPRESNATNADERADAPQTRNVGNANAENTTAGVALVRSSGTTSQSGPQKPVLFTPSQRIDHFFASDVSLPSVENLLDTPDGNSAGMGFGQNGGLYQQLGLRAHANGSLTSAQAMPMSQLQVVIQKLAERGDTRSITVQLDPVELGRVQIELSSGRDKMLKANILVEKPEAFALLQRDMSSLEKALQNAGIQLDGDQVSLDLADNNTDQGGNSFAQQAFADLAKEQHEFSKGGPLVVTIDDLIAPMAPEPDVIPSSPLHSLMLMSGVNITV